MESAPLPLPSYKEVVKSEAANPDSAQKLPPPYQDNTPCKRTMPIVYSFTERGPFLFLSEEFFNKFKHTNFDKDYQIDLQNAGLPLLICIRTSGFKRMLGKSSFVIYQYSLQELETGASNGKPISQDGKYGLYKTPFCWIFRKAKKGITTYSFKYAEGKMGSEHELVVENGGYSGVLNGTEFYYVFPDGKYDKMMLILGSNPVSGLYTTEERDNLPLKHSKFAHLILSENPSARMSTTTLQMACQGLLINYLVRVRFLDERVNKRYPPRSAVWDCLWEDQ